jgi:hypothetical protein
MDAMREAIKKIHAEPEHATSRTLSDLIRSLDSGGQFDLNRLYQLNYSDFSLAMTLLQQWRLDSYCYERGTLAKAASDVTVEVDVAALRYGRWEQVAPV